MKKSSLQTSILATLLALTVWLAGSWWYYACQIKNTCSSQKKPTITDVTHASKSEDNSNDNKDNESSEPLSTVDTDGDGLYDVEEVKLGTDPLLMDTDRDSISDSEEIGVDIDSPLDSDDDNLIDALDVDDDNDGLSTADEEKLGTSSLHADTDEDGILDAVEIGPDLTMPLDTDADGIINALDTDDDDDNVDTVKEVLLGTNHLLVDTDGDGLSDEKELGDKKSQPLDTDKDGILDAVDNKKEPDQDKDGLPDTLEVRLNTNPNKADTDGDGIDDGTEVGNNIYEPLDRDLDGTIDALDTVDDSDSDNDGLLDTLEVILKSNPNKADSDADGINDLIELGENKDKPLDTDSDGILNINDDDDDNDKLSTSFELKIGTNPLLQDSDKDTVLDNVEALLEDSSSIKDTDGDGIIDPIDNDDDNDKLSTLKEIALGTNPLLSDTDKDGISDFTEIGNNLEKPLDSDKDGIIDALDTTDNIIVEKSTTSANDTTEYTISMLDKGDIKQTLLSKIQTVDKNTEATAQKKTENNSGTNKVKTKETTKLDNDKGINHELKGESKKGEIQASILYFPNYSTNPQIEDETKAYLEQIAKWMKKSPDNQIQLTGHTDNTGSKKANLSMGIKRVMIIRRQLIDRGAPMRQIEILSRGEAEPIQSNKTELGRLRNRRVEIAPLLKK